MAKISVDRRNRAKVKLRISIEPAENGGHVVEHQRVGGEHYEGPKQYAFGSKKETLKHLDKHLGGKPVMGKDGDYDEDAEPEEGEE